MQDAVRSHDELRIIGDPSFCFAFYADGFNIYHVNDFMAERGWRFNGLQNPDGIHMCVTRPQTRPGIVEAFAADLDAAVEYGTDHADDQPASAAVYGSVPTELEGFVADAIVGILDAQQSVPG